MTNSVPAKKARELTPDELWRLCARQAELFSAGDSSSLPESTARELVSSVRFTLKMGMEEGTQAPPEVILERGRLRLEAMTRLGRRLWSRACLTPPGVENDFYRDTLKSIGVFFRRYDVRFFAHQVLCDIDYQLCLPVPEAMEGVEYVNEYLRRILAENAVLRRFDAAQADALLRQQQPDYKRLAVNLCEPVIVNAAGRLATGLGLNTLLCGDDDRAAIARVFLPLSDWEADETLSAAGDRLADLCGLRAQEEKNYVSAAAKAARSRIMAALGAGDISGVFLSGVQ